MVCLSTLMISRSQVEEPIECLGIQIMGSPMWTGAWEVLGTSKGSKVLNEQSELSSQQQGCSRPEQPKGVLVTIGLFTWSKTNELMRISYK